MLPETGCHFIPAFQFSPTRYPVSVCNFYLGCVRHPVGKLVTLLFTGCQATIQLSQAILGCLQLFSKHVYQLALFRQGSIHLTGLLKQLLLSFACLG